MSTGVESEHKVHDVDSVKFPMSIRCDGSRFSSLVTFLHHSKLILCSYVRACVRVCVQASNSSFERDSDINVRWRWYLECLLEVERREHGKSRQENSHCSKCCMRPAHESSKTKKQS